MQSGEVYLAVVKNGGGKQGLKKPTGFAWLWDA